MNLVKNVMMTNIGFAMKMLLQIIVLLLFDGRGVHSVLVDYHCEERLNNCTAEMQPVLKESRYMFPTTHSEVEGMCKIWSHIMDCIRKFMTDCSTEEQKTKFNEAVSDSIDSVHAICSSERYRRDYLENSHCFKKVSIENCGVHFRKMIDSAYNPLSAESHICCAYSQYEKCVSEPIQRLCGPHTLHLLDHSMSSLKSRCEIITHKLKLTGNGCSTIEPLPPPISLNAISEPQKSPRLDSDSYNPLTTSSYMVSTSGNYRSNLGWAPSTVIYPMTGTRQSSRFYRNSSNFHRSSGIGIWMAIGTIVIVCLI